MITWISALFLLGTAGFVSDVSDNYFEISKNLDIFGHLYREVNSIYVEETDPGDLMRVGIDAMLGSLDPYTTFISEEEAEEVAFMSTGQYGGIGAVVRKRAEEMIIISCYKGYPADRGGLLPGDRIVQVEAQRIDPAIGIDGLRQLLRGEKGEGVTLTVQRPGQADEQTFTIVRDRIQVENVPFAGMATEDIGFISLAGFTQGASREVQLAYQQLRQANPQMKGLMLDLRGNPGGRLDEAVKVTNLFVPQQSLIVETRGRKENNRRRHEAVRAPIDVDIPLVVLVNGKSASASEIVAGAIQDLDRGVIVGQRSFGKGLVQNIRPLSYNTQLKVTTAKYYTPSGRCIQALDYGTKNAQGQASPIPDSLRMIYRTANGREVRDGGGVEPDRTVALTMAPPLTEALLEQGLIFDFATQFVQTHDRIPSPRLFTISDALFDEFVAYIEAKGFSYQTMVDEELMAFKEVVAEEAYAEQLSEDIASIETALAQLKDNDLYAHKDEIKALLRRHIVARYYYQAGERELGLDQDPEVAAAIEILNAPANYNRILGQ